MPAQTGRTNSKWIQVYISNSSGILTEITPYVKSVGTLGLTYDTTDVTVYSDFVKNFTVGQPGAPLSISGPFDTTLYAMMIAYNTAGRTTISGWGLSFDVRIGIQHTWVTGEPVFGITGSLNAGYQITSFTVDSSAMTWQATLEVVGPTAPQFTTLAHT
jgi:hypothetical protein